MAVNYREIQKRCLESKAKAIPGKRRFKRRVSAEIKVPVCLPQTLPPRTLFCHCIPSNASSELGSVNALNCSFFFQGTDSRMQRLTALNQASE